MTCLTSRDLTPYGYNVKVYDVAYDARGPPGGGAPLYDTPAQNGNGLEKNVPRPYMALNPEGWGARGLIGFVFRVCLSPQKNKKF